jgi:hypothetical protein
MVTPRVRDYAREYRQRIARGLRLGRTRRQARGHPGAGEAYASGLEKPTWDPRLEEGLRRVRGGKSVPEAAGAVDERPENLRDYLARTGVGEKVGGRWRVGEDQRIREWTFYSGGKRVWPRLSFDESRKAGEYMSQVGHALDTNDPKVLAPFKGEGVTDVEGRFWPFETRMNVLYRLSADRDEPYEAIYRIVA